MRFLFLFLLSSSLHASLIVSSVVSIYDADTFRVNLPNCPELFCLGIPVRVAGIDAPEIRGKCDYERALARKAKYLTVELLKSAQVIEIRNPQRGKYFRIIGDVYVDGVRLADKLILSGLAREYYGGTRHGWCS